MTDHIPADKIRDILTGISNGVYEVGVGRGVSGIAEDLRSLLPAPKLPTLEELVARGDDPEHYLWMQCQIAETSRRGVITGFDDTEEFDLFTSVTFRGENDTWFDPALIVPLPDEQRMEWPPTGVPVTEDTPEPAPGQEQVLPRPDDVPEGEAWLVLCGCVEWAGTRNKYDGSDPWSITRMDGLGHHNVSDSDITLVSRLVPEEATE